MVRNMLVNGHNSQDSAGNAVGYAAMGFITLAQAAGYLAVSAKTIRRWVSECGLPHYYVRRAPARRGVLLFRTGEIDRWMKQHRNASPVEGLDNGAPLG